jgi:hypothetical protein
MIRTSLLLCVGYRLSRREFDWFGLKQVQEGLRMAVVAGWGLTVSVEQRARANLEAKCQIHGSWPSEVAAVISYITVASP